MYKSKLIGLVLVIAMLAGCSTKESVSQPAQTEPPIDLPYEIIRDDDGYYLVLDDSSATDDEVEGSLQVLAPRIEFGSMDEMVRDIKTGNFTEKELQNLSRFRKDEDGRTILCDLSKLYDVYTPEEFDEKKILWSGAGYHFVLLGTGSDFQVHMYSISDSSKEENIENLISCDSVVNFTLLSTEQIEDRNATVIIFTSETYYGVKDHKRVYYTIRDENKEVFVCENYTPSTDVVPSTVYIYGTENGMNYVVNLRNLQERPSVEYLMGFGYREYVETEVA